MTGQSTKILIIGDELSLGEPLMEACQKEGFTVYHILKPGEAMARVASNDLDYVFIDCMLNGANGVDLVQKMKQETPELKAKIVLMSGIYTDKVFIQEATQKTKAVAFIKKY